MSITNATRLSDFAAGIGTEGAILKIDNANQRVGIGTQLPNQMLTVAGIVSATQYIGDGSQLEGITSAGLGTAIDETEGSAGAVIYFTDDLLTVSETTTVNPPASASAAYTQYRDVKLNDSVDLIIETGDDFIPDILGFGEDTTDPNAAGNGVFDEVYAGVIKNKNGLGAPAFANGLTSVGVITATGGFTGDVTGNVNNSSNLVLKVDGGEKVRVTSAGKVGINSISPGEHLDVVGNVDIKGGFNQLRITTGSPAVKFTDSDAPTGFGMIGVNNTSGSLVLRSDDGNALSSSFMGFEVDGYERLRIGSAGQLGIAGANYGTAGQVLSSQGASAAPQWANAAGGAWEVVSSTALSGSTSDLQLYGWSNNYAQYKVVFQDCYNASDIKMRIQFYTDATSGNNGTLVTSSNYSYTGGYISWNSTSGPTIEAGNASHFYPYTTAAGGSAEIYTGELIFPMKTSGYNDACKCYGTMMAHQSYWPFISCELNANTTHFLTGIHIYFIESGNTNPLSPTTGRITLLRMKYS